LEKILLRRPRDPMCLPQDPMIPIGAPCFLGQKRPRVKCLCVSPLFKESHNKVPQKNVSPSVVTPENSRRLTNEKIFQKAQKSFPPRAPLPNQIWGRNSLQNERPPWIPPLGPPWPLFLKRDPFPKRNIKSLLNPNVFSCLCALEKRGSFGPIRESPKGVSPKVGKGNVPDWTKS